MHGHILEPMWIFTTTLSPAIGDTCCRVYPRFDIISRFMLAEYYPGTPVGAQHDQIKVA